jgi:eukaryotic-like serine/threonine-protein kinase
MEERKSSIQPFGETVDDSVANEPTEVAEVTKDGVVTTTPSPDAETTGEMTDRFIGRVLANRYKITRRIGTGGFGAVFEAEDTKIRKRVAVKVLTRDLVTDSAILARFRLEAEAASKTGHENIVDITDFDRTTDDYYFMVMEYLDGIDLGKLIRSGEELAIARVITIMIQVCRALYAVHNAGVIHRDLKPGNVILTVRGSRPDFVKLLDFGISKFMEMDDESSRLTKTGQIIGTPLYMAPEQAIGEENVDHRADIYSMGVIMYELITGQPPFTAVNYLGIIAQHASDPPRPPTKVRPDLEIPKSLELIILKAMAKRPEDRFSTTAEMEGALIQTLASVDPAIAVSYSPDRTPPSLLLAQTGLSQRRLKNSTRLPLWALLAVAAVVGVGVALWAANPWSSDPAGSGGPVTDLGLAVVPTTPDLTVVASAPDAGLPAPREVVISISSKPGLATVFDAAGKELGKTPLKHTVRSGAAKLTFSIKRRRYKPVILEVTPDKAQSHEVVLKRKYSGGGLPDDPKGWGQR